ECKTDSWSQVVFIRRNLTGVDSCCCKLRVRVLRRRLRNTLKIVTNPEIHGQPRIETNVILEEPRKFRQVRFGCSACGAGSREGLNVPLTCANRTPAGN